MKLDLEGVEAYLNSQRQLELGCEPYGRWFLYGLLGVAAIAGLAFYVAYAA